MIGSNVANYVCYTLQTQHHKHDKGHTAVGEYIHHRILLALKKRIDQQNRFIFVLH